MFFRNKKINSSVRKVDKIVTTVIIGSAIASIFGLSQTKKGKEISKDVKQKVTPIVQRSGNSFLRIFGRFLAFIVGIFTKK